MSLPVALLLGLVQGLTEFLPVSSSGHLTLVPFILGLDEPTVAFDVAVHFGTLVGLVWVLRDRIAPLVRTLAGWSGAAEQDRRLVRLLAIGTIPAAVVGIALNGPIENAFERPVLVSVFLGVTGYILFATESGVDRREREARGEETIDSADAVTIGVAQAVAALPGISRSGATIAAGMHRGLARADAARFSFVLAIPVILGATAVKVPDFVDAGLQGAGPFLVGTVAAAISGALAVRWFLGIIERRGLRPFGAYCFFAMTAGLLTAMARG